MAIQKQAVGGYGLRAMILLFPGSVWREPLALPLQHILLANHLKEYLGKHFSLLSAVAPTPFSEVVLSLNPSLTTGQMGSPSCVCPFRTGGRRLSTARKREVVSLMSRPYFLSLQIFPILGIFYRKENHTHKLHSTQDTNKAMLSVMMLFNGIPTYPLASC